jgi:hypothetical protein
MAYSHEENSIVERANKEVLRHLKAILYSNLIEDQWDIYLPIIHRIVNSNQHSSIGVSPATLLFGNTIQLDSNIIEEISYTLPQKSDQKLSD